MIFLSYARTDGLEYILRLEADLSAAGFVIWRDQRSLNEYNDFSAEIEINIRQADFVVVVVTPSIEQNPNSFVRREILYAQSKNKPIIPLVFPGADLPVSIIHLTYIDFQDFEAGCQELIARLRKPPQSSPQPQTDDPLRPYLQNLYEWIVSYLEKTVFSLMTLRAEATPEAVTASLLPVTFLDTFSAMAGIQSSYNNFNEAFEKYNGRVLLLGEPGAGKTTTLMAFARERVVRRLENPALLLPVLAPIVTWDAEVQPPLIDWLSRGYPNEKALIAQQIRQGKALLLLDGLDELGRVRENPHTRERYDPRSRFLKLIPKNNLLLVTCREQDYRDIGEKISLNGAVTLCPLDDAQMKNYLRDLPGLWSALEKDTALREVARTPLLLSLFSAAFRDAEVDALADLSRGDLRDKIIETYVNRNYEREARKPYAELPFSLEEMHQWLRDLALKNIFSVRVAVDRRLLELAVRLHILVADSPDTWRFVHLLVRDYFGYQAGLAWLNSQSRGNAARFMGISVLDRLADPRAVPAIIAILSDPTADKVLRQKAARTLGVFGDPRALEPLRVMLENEEDMSLRITAAASLTRLARSKITGLRLSAHRLENPYALELEIERLDLLERIRQHWAKQENRMSE